MLATIGASRHKVKTLLAGIDEIFFIHHNIRPGWRTKCARPRFWREIAESRETISTEHTGRSKCGAIRNRVYFRRGTLDFAQNFTGQAQCVTIPAERNQSRPERHDISQ